MRRFLLRAVPIGALISLAAIALRPGAAHGQIFVANEDSPGNSESIVKFTAAGWTTLVGGLNQPTGIAVSGPDMFVASFTGGTVSEYTTSGQTVNASLISLPPSNLSSIDSMTMSGSNLFLTTQNVVAEYTKSGALVNSSLISGLNNAGQITASGSNLYILSQTPYTISGTISEYTTSGKFVNSFLIPRTDLTESFAVSGSDVFLNSEGLGPDAPGTVSEYTTSGATVNASLITGLSGGGSIAVSGNDLFVSTGVNGVWNIDEYSKSGDFQNVTLDQGLYLPGPILVQNNPFAPIPLPPAAWSALGTIGLIGLVGSLRARKRTA
jgi:hypothetical protein